MQCVCVRTCLGDSARQIGMGMHTSKRSSLNTPSALELHSEVVGPGEHKYRSRDFGIDLHKDGRSRRVVRSVHQLAEGESGTGSAVAPTVQVAGGASTVVLCLVKQASIFSTFSSVA